MRFLPPRVLLAALTALCAVVLCLPANSQAALPQALIEKLALGEASVNTLAEPLDMSLPGVSKHLKVLQRAGLVVQGRDAQRRPCRLNPRRLQDVAIWAERFRANWEESFGRLDEYLLEITKKEKK